jgi:hypothetical protein
LGANAAYPSFPGCIYDLSFSSKLYRVILALKHLHARPGIWDQDETEIRAPKLDNLVTITLNDFRGLDREVTFLGLLLSWAPALEELKINIPEDTSDQGY